MLSPHVRVFSSHHPSQLLGCVAVLRLLIAYLGELLGFAACVVAAPLAEDDVSNLHFVVRRVDLQDFGFGEFGGVLDLGRAMFVDDLVAAVSFLSAAPFSLFYWLAAAGSAVLDPLFVHDAFKFSDVGCNLLVLLLACDSSCFYWRWLRFTGFASRRCIIVVGVIEVV